MDVRLLDDRELWNAWVVGCPTGNILQSYEWGEFKACFDWQIIRAGLYESGRICGLALLLVRHTPAGTIAYCPRGPLIDYGDKDLVTRAFDALHELARDQGASFLKIEPPALDSPAFTAQMDHLGFRPSEEVQPRSTIIIDLAADIDALRARLNIKTRYNVGLATRKNVRILQGDDQDASKFYELLERTSEREEFSIHSRDYYEKAWSILRPRGMAQLLLASCEGEVVAGTMIFVTGTQAYYMYGASNGKHRNVKPSDLLQWESIKWAHSIGCTSYDMWGIPDEVGAQVHSHAPAQAIGNGGDEPVHSYQRNEDGPIPSPWEGEGRSIYYKAGGSALNGHSSNDKANGSGNRTPSETPHPGVSTVSAEAAASPLWGVYLFKRGFGGQVVRYAGCFDYVYSPVQYWLWTKALPFQRQLFGKLKKLQPLQPTKGC